MRKNRSKVRKEMGISFCKLETEGEGVSDENDAEKERKNIRHISKEVGR